MTYRTVGVKLVGMARYGTRFPVSDLAVRSMFPFGGWACTPFCPNLSLYIHVYARTLKHFYPLQLGSIIRE